MRKPRNGTHNFLIVDTTNAQPLDNIESSCPSQAKRKYRRLNADEHNHPFITAIAKEILVAHMIDKEPAK